MKTTIAVTSDKEALETINTFFAPREMTVKSLPVHNWLQALPSGPIEFCFVDVEALNQGGGRQENLDTLWHHQPDVEVVVMSHPSAIEGAVDAVQSGASHYLTYPLVASEISLLLETTRKDQRLHSELSYLRKRMQQQSLPRLTDTQSPEMRRVLDKLRAVAQTDTTVLLTGETGTGKNRFAQWIHSHSRRSSRPLIQVHCGAIPDSLLESELFGHEKGAFTGAIRRKAGKFEIANGGTLFLDEISTITPAMQIKLLQVLQDGAFQRVGSEVTLNTDFRLIVASNEDLQLKVRAGTFRQDLYYRLHVFPVQIPALRARKADIPAISRQILDRLNQKGNKQITDIAPEVMKALKTYDWPGNIRELEHIIERAFVLEPGTHLTAAGLPADLMVQHKSLPAEGTLDQVRREAVYQVEHDYLTALLRKHHGRIKESAHEAGIGVRQLHKLLTRHHLDKMTFRKQ